MVKVGSGSLLLSLVLQYFALGSQSLTALILSWLLFLDLLSLQNHQQNKFVFIIHYPVCGTLLC
jgi:hypothetical protein